MPVNEELPVNLSSPAIVVVVAVTAAPATAKPDSTIIALTALVAPMALANVTPLA